MNWIPVTKCYPEPKVDVLTCDAQTGLMSVAEWHPEAAHGEGQWLDEGAVTVTHWRRLPQLPLLGATTLEAENADYKEPIDELRARVEELEAERSDIDQPAAVTKIAELTAQRDEARALLREARRYWDPQDLPSALRERIKTCLAGEESE